MYIRGLIPRNFAELAEAVPIGPNGPNCISRGGVCTNISMKTYSRVLYFSLFFGPATVHCDLDPVINRSTGATLDDLVADLVRSIDYNGDGILDIDEVRKGLIGQFAGPGKYKPNQHTISGNYKPVFLHAYWEH